MYRLKEKILTKYCVIVIYSSKNDVSPHLYRPPAFRRIEVYLNARTMKPKNRRNRAHKGMCSYNVKEIKDQQKMAEENTCRPIPIS